MAIFKESKKSLRWFLILVGVFGLYSSITGLASFGQLPPLDSLIFIVSAILNLATLYIGITFNNLLQTKSESLIKFFWFSIIWAVLNAVYLYFSGLVNAGIFIFFGIGVLIDFVIINSIKRLSKDNI